MGLCRTVLDVRLQGSGLRPGLRRRSCVEARDAVGALARHLALKVPDKADCVTNSGTCTRGR